MRPSRLALAAAVAALSVSGSAGAFDPGLPEDPENHRAPLEELPAAAGELHVRIERYRPALDSGLAARPYEQVFGSAAMWGARLEYAKTWPRRFGTPGLGLGAGYLSVSGHGLYLDSSGSYQRSADDTALHLVPVSAFAMFRLDEPLRRLGLPMAPYARVDLVHVTWIASGTEQATHTGGTSGWSFGAGVALFLDDLDHVLSFELYRELGVRHVMLTFDAGRSFIDDFGAGGFRLSSDGWSFAGGLGFSF